MDKRYQVFVSSTYVDLQDERQKVLQTLMEMDCIPAGMELFPALDEEQWEFIKKIIDDCDYYIIIIGARYGSVTNEGISYTEKEFDYALEKGIKIIALIHEEPDAIPFNKNEGDPEKRAKLSAFKDKIKTGRLVKFWNTANEIPGLVTLSLLNTIKRHPAIGWVRANQIAQSDLLIETHERTKEIEELKKINTILKNENDILSKSVNTFENIADFDSLFNIRVEYKIGNPSYPRKVNTTISISWKNLFSLISPFLLEPLNDSLIKNKITNCLKEYNNIEGFDHKINMQDFKTISIQFKAYQLVDIKYLSTNQGTKVLFWLLTEYGESIMMRERIVKNN